jgi:transcriptional regulator with XRE-family HTH domain
MSISKSANPSKKSTRIQAALSLANTVQRRRQNLGMSVERAAGLTGMQVSEWCALEAGWVPGTPGVLRAVADTLELGYSQLSFLAEISEFNQIDPA